MLHCVLSWNTSYKMVRVAKWWWCKRAWNKQEDNELTIFHTFLNCSHFIGCLFSLLLLLWFYTACFKRAIQFLPKFNAKRGFEAEANAVDVADDDQTCSYSFSCKYCQKANYHHKKIHSENWICNSNFYVIVTSLICLIFSILLISNVFDVSNNSILNNPNNTMK